MALTRGTLIGHYEVVQLLGAGGMGEVYRARDTKLGRDVALKILADAFVGDPDRLERFQREAMTLASLNHPHIAHIHGVEESGPTRALVMELVEGEDLAHRLARGAIPVAEALPIAQQIAEALEAAHDAGVIHRDLKPANIKLRPDGTVKVLDFGLAKALDPAGVQATLANSPTIMSPGMTNPGVLLGTAAYMPPEQAKGRAVDRRADIWAFGCVVFEMISGQRCFPGDTVAETLAAVLEREPPWTALPDTTPEAIRRRLLRRCLQKDPKRRLRDIADARVEVEEAMVAPPSHGHAQPALVRRGVHPAIWLALATLVIAAAAISRFGSPAAAPRDIRVHRLTDLAGLEEAPALSPDGKSVAFTAGVDGTRQVFVQLLAGGPPLPLTREPIDHEFPRWLPDSSSLVYFSPPAPGEPQGTLWEVSALGGSPRRLVGAIGTADVSRRDGRLAFFRLADQGVQLATMPRDGSVEVVTTLPATTYYLYPRWSADGRSIAFQRGDSIRFDLFVVAAAGGEPRQVTRENSMIGGFAWLPDSTGLLYSSSRGNTMPYLPTLNLWQVSLEDGTMQQITTGEASYQHPDIGANGAIAASRLRLQTDIWKYPADDSPEVNVSRGTRLTHQTGHVLTPTAGPGDTEVAFLSDRGGHANVWVANVETGAWRQVTHERDPNVAIGVPVWSPDGRAIAFVSTRGNPGLTFGVWLVSPDGSNMRNVANPGLGPAWSHDGRAIYYSTRGGATRTDVVLMKMPVEGGTPVTVTTERLRNVIGSDGATLYYMLERLLVDGTPEFEIRSATPENAPFRVLARIPPSRVPIWQIVNPALSPDGKWLAQALTDGLTTNVWALSTSTGEWRQITDFGDGPTFIVRRVSWSSDGRSIVAAVGEGDADVVLLEGLLQTGRD